MEIKQGKTKIIFNSEEMASLIKAYELLDELENLMYEQDYQKLLTKDLDIPSNLLTSTLAVLDALSEKETLEVE